MVTKINAFIFTLALIAAAGCQAGSNDKKSNSDSSLNSDTTITKDVSVMTESALVADNGEEGSDLADVYRLGIGFEPGGDKIESCGSHCSHRTKCGQSQDVTHNVTIDSTWTFSDCNGNHQEAYDSSETESIELVSDASGNFTSPKMTKTFTRNADIKVTGLCGNNKDFTVNGKAWSDSQMTFFTTKVDAIRYYSVETSTDITNVIISTNSWFLLPLSGSITIVMTIEKANDSEFKDIISHVVKTVVITFNGTTKPEIVIN